MREIIQQYFAKCTPEIGLCTDLIFGISQERRTSSTGLASYIRGDATTTSKERKIERFYENHCVNPQLILDAIIKMFGQQKITLSLDRTNWEFGKQSINAFAAFASKGKVGSLVGLTMLSNKGGNTKSTDRIELVKEVIKNYGEENIQVLLGDREFFSLIFAAWLIEKKIAICYPS